ncbi:MAG: hypothetical protein F6J98_07020 [Moorea sp. SIO4G2]|uniref:hypothetical protein n=1 Tax=Moorena bouillonii TaxID=207920 RepID=UPI0011811EA7|nr:hypothetical protein [Moorena bouillonii]NEO44196.1 hypothetical protein [Moorena sp. SIO4A3]NEO60190.1 hypothetical protein [Moorena sp. SIO4G2]
MRCPRIHPCSLLPAPCSLKPRSLYLTELKTAVAWLIDPKNKILLTLIPILLAIALQSAPKAISPKGYATRSHCKIKVDEVFKEICQAKTFTTTVSKMLSFW